MIYIGQAQIEILRQPMPDLVKEVAGALQDLKTKTDKPPPRTNRYRDDPRYQKAGKPWLNRKAKDAKFRSN